MNRPACVLFDLDDTLVRYDHETRVRTLAERSGAAPERVEWALFGSGLERESDLGRHDADGHACELSKRLGATVSLEDCIAARAAAMTPIDACIALAHRVARNAHVAILTNNGALVRDHSAALCPALSPLFDGRVLCSADFGIAKPNPSIFVQAAKRLGFAREDILFIDDKEWNAKSARSIGMRALHYRDPDGLRDALHACGLLADTPALS